MLPVEKANHRNKRCSSGYTLDDFISKDYEGKLERQVAKSLT
jgi:hypothetical protein